MLRATTQHRFLVDNFWRNRAAHKRNEGVAGII